jgi:hypothetical protein
MSINCSGSKRGLASSSLWMSLCERGMTVKENNGGGWNSDDVVLWLGRRQNGDMIEWWGEWARLRRSFRSNGE